MMETRGSGLLTHWEGTKAALQSRLKFLHPVPWDPRAYRLHLENLDLVSPDQLLGHDEGGREWGLWFMLPKLVPRGRALVFMFSFWGCPKGRTSERLLPYFFIGPPLSLLGWKGGVTRGAAVLKAARRDYGKDAVLPLTARAPWGEVAACSSYPPATSAIRSEPWLKPLFGWYSTILGYVHDRVDPPTFVGSGKSGVITVPYDVLVPQDVYVSVLRELKALLEDLESKFGVTSQLGTRMEQTVRTSTGLVPASLCPKCGRLSPIAFVNDLFGAPLNERTSCCKALVYHQA